MKARLEQRLEELKGELDQGQKMLTELDRQRMELEQKLLRISGAVQVLEEELAAASEEKEPRAQEGALRPVAASANDQPKEAVG